MVLHFPALDPRNPLGYLAALGLLKILDEAALGSSAARPTLSFGEGGETAAIRTELTFEQLVSVVLEDAKAQATALAFGFAYRADGARVSISESEAIRDLKPSPSAAREVLLLAASATRRDGDLFGSFFSELVQASTSGDTKPTALHFTAGQQEFLKMAEALRVGIGPDDLREALLGPWRSESKLPSLSWDSSVSRLYALRASDPSKDKRGTVAGANWLAFHALAYFPVAVSNGRLVTTRVQGGWKSSVFEWPIWAPFIESSTVAALLRIAPDSWTASERAAMGVSMVCRSAILRSDQGGYGSFAPAEVVLPKRHKASSLA